MKHIVGMTLLATIAMSLVALPVDAQPRGGSRGGGPSRSGGGSRPSSSMSSPSRSSGGASRSYSAPTRSYSSPSRSSSYGSPSRSSSAPTRSYSSPSRSSSAPSRSYSAPQTRSVSPQARSSSPQTRSVSPQARSSSPQPRSVTPQTRSNSSPSRSSSSYGTAQRQTSPQARRSTPQTGNVTRSGDVNNNRQPVRSNPQIASRSNPGANPGARTSVRPQPGQPHNFTGGREPREVHMRPGPGHDVGRHHPRHRDPLPFNRPSRFWDRGPHYFGYRVHYIPARRIVRYYWGVPYYIVDGLYYRCYNDYYYICRPPFGVFFDPIIDNIAGAICHFAYYNSVYNTYRTINENAETITAQNRIIAENNATIAQQNADIALNTERALAAQQAADDLGLVQSYGDAQVEYYYDDGVFFTKDKDGKYITIVPPAGALVQELPEDYDTITLDGKEYYKVDNTIFRTTIVDGSAYFEVLGQMTGELADQYDLYK